MPCRAAENKILNSAAFHPLLTSPHPTLPDRDRTCFVYVVLGIGRVDSFDCSSRSGGREHYEDDEDEEDEEEEESHDGGNGSDAMIPGQSEKHSAISNILPSSVGRLFS